MTAKSFTMRSSWAVTLLFLASEFVCAQPQALCQIKPPTLRGFYLGETVAEINKVIPNFRAAFDRNRARNHMYPDAQTESGFTMVSGVDVFTYENGKPQTRRAEYDDVEFFWHFLDEKLFFISVQYMEYEPPNLSSFIRQLTEKTDLPKQGWVIKDREHAVLHCAGLNVDVWTGYSEKKFTYPSVMLTDTIANGELERRRKAIELLKRNAELERARREKERHSILKP